MNNTKLPSEGQPDASPIPAIPDTKPDIRTAAIDDIAAYLGRDINNQEQLAFMAFKYQAQRDTLLEAAKTILGTEPLSSHNRKLLKAAVSKAEQVPDSFELYESCPGCGSYDIFSDIGLADDLLWDCADCGLQFDQPARSRTP